jgi:AraC-like DNA-binding protein
MSSYGDDYTLEEERNVHVWNIADFSSTNAFRQYREFMTEGPLRADIEYKSEEPFRVRFEVTPVGAGLIFRIRCSPHTVMRTREQCSDHGVDGFHVIHVLSGGASIEASRHVKFAGKGDTFVFDGRLPYKTTTIGQLPELIGICVPRNTLGPEEIEALSNGLNLLKCRTPIASCLELMAQRVGDGSLAEFESLYNASVALTSVELLQHDRSPKVAAANSYLLRQMLLLIDRDIDERNLSPQYVANKFSISVRYVHKLFATTGTTCAAYILQRRLEHVWHDLIANPRESIASLAIRWGFNEVGHFNRAFKRHFGYTPSKVRMR